ncbi:hypothetical protein [Streptomyces sp. NPDC048172]|uniref:hypothetical protein n=1 Tax=Streptomyces sp. NPDC048172 TaxID=3365505 RepID=UPI003721AC11
MSSIHTGAVFNSGPLLRLLELTIRSQESRGMVSLDDEIARFDRTNHYSAVATWNMPTSSSAALLELVADLLEEQPGYPVPSGFRERLDRAADGMAGPDYLRILAGLLRFRAREGPMSFRLLPPAAWEVECLFPLLRGFGDVWLSTGDHPDHASAVDSRVRNEHPTSCYEDLAALAAEAQTALFLFPEPERMAAALKPILFWVSPDRLRQLLDAATAHIAEHHKGSRRA